MAHKRTQAPRKSLAGDELIRSMAGIGMRFAAKPIPRANIEDALMSAAVAAMEQDDLRGLGMVTAWLAVHHAQVNVDRLVRAAPFLGGDRTRAFWSAVARWMAKDRRWHRLESIYSGPRLDVVRTGGEFLIKRHGEDPRFIGTNLRVPATALRERPGDVLTPRELARVHRAYHYRIMLGPVYRADMWAELDRNPGLAPAELARRTYGSFATAWQLKRDFATLVA
jgi:hypothetical protein